MVNVDVVLTYNNLDSAIIPLEVPSDLNNPCVVGVVTETDEPVGPVAPVFVATPVGQGAPVGPVSPVSP